MENWSMNKTMTKEQAIELLKGMSEHLLYDGQPDGGKVFVNNLLTGQELENTWAAIGALGGKAVHRSNIPHRILVTNGDEFARTLEESGIEFRGETSFRFVERYLGGSGQTKAGQDHGRGI